LDNTDFGTIVAGEESRYPWRIEMNRTARAAAFAAALASLAALGAGNPCQAQGAAALPVTKVVLFSSGVGYFEHRGPVTGDSVVSLPFASSEVNDALKSLVVADGAGDQAASPSVSYPSQASLDRALKGFRVDLSGSPRVADLVARLRGAEVSIDTPETVTGRIVSVEARPTKDFGEPRPYVVLLSKSGLRSVSLDDAQAIRFSDKGIGEDFDRALSLILGARDDKRRSLEIRLPGSGSRQASIGYVIAAPVWKASYRLDLAPDKPQFQGWAIVDNPSDLDWKGVALSLVSGRPVSFIQDLYPPLYLDRPTLPLMIAGIAAARSFDSGLAGGPAADEESLAELAAPSAKSARKEMAPPAPAMARAPSGAYAPEPRPSPMGSGAALETTRVGEAGDQFEFTVKKPVSLERGKSAMLPLVAGDIAAERVSIYSPGSASRHPMLGARLSNTTGIRLPAGPIVVFDGGVYAGDALLDFFPERDSRLVVFGEDLGVISEVSASSSQETVGVTVSKGVMTFSRRLTIAKTYAFKNGASKDKKIVVEHPISSGAELFEPKASEEKTESVYRFSLALPAGGEAKLVVKERSPRSERIVLGGLRPEDFLSYSSSQEIPAVIREALKKAIELRKRLEDAQRSLTELQKRKETLAADQSRYRDNLDSVGRDSTQGQQYLKRLMDAETSIDQTGAKITDAQKAATDAQKAYEAYIAGLSL
jgi:hypothetical protein